jgi:hypothetical protein
MPRLFALLLLAAAAPSQAQAQPAADPEPALASAALPAEQYRLHASRTDFGAIELDGVLDEPAWAEAEHATGFVQLRPAPGEPASERTEARVLYDGSAVYVGMRMHDSQPEAIGAALGRRDTGPESDWAQVMLDSYDDSRTAFGFMVNAAGVQLDFLMFDDVNEDNSWDAVWQAETSRDSEGWTAEFRIPLSQLRFAAGNERWGLNFGRKHFRTGEHSFWAPLVPGVDGVVSRFGTLDELRGLESPRQLEIQPYVAASLTRAPGEAADPYYAENDFAPQAGVDLKYGLTGDLTLTATLNPDFGQVEADPSQVNLGGFELFFQERRPFFVEGTDVFSMQPRRFFATNRPDLLYTRRIGRQPQRSGFVPEGIEENENATVYTDSPQQSTILGAAKLSGRVGRFSVGVLNAVTAREYGRFQAFDDAGQRLDEGRGVVEPVTNYFVGRARGTFGKTIVGGLVTSVVRDTGDPAIAAMLPVQSTVAGFDVEQPFGDWRFSAQVVGSHSSGDTAAITRLQSAFPRLYQRPDAGHLGVDSSATALAGVTGEVNFMKTNSTYWSGGLHLSTLTPGFDANALGFQSRADYTGVGGSIGYRLDDGIGPFQRFSTSSYAGAGWNYAGDRTATFGGTNANGQFHNFWGVNGNVNWGLRTANDRLTRGGPIANGPANFNVNGNVWSDERKPVSGYVWGRYDWDEFGSRGWGVDTGLDVRPSEALQFSLSPGYFVDHEARQFVTSFDDDAATETFGRRYVFGGLNSTTFAMSTRVNWTFTPDLTLQLFARPFVTRGRYETFKAFPRPGTGELPVYGEDLGSVSREGSVVTVDPGDGGEPFELEEDFTFRSLQGNAVLRWEYRPGSALFLVWQQQRNASASDGQIRYGRDVRGLFTDEAENIFLLKLSYWLG